MYAENQTCWNSVCGHNLLGSSGFMCCINFSVFEPHSLSLSPPAECILPKTTVAVSHGIVWASSWWLSTSGESTDGRDWSIWPLPNQLVVTKQPIGYDPGLWHVPSSTVLLVMVPLPFIYSPTMRNVKILESIYNKISTWHSRKFQIHASGRYSNFRRTGYTMDTTKPFGNKVITCGVLPVNCRSAP